MSGSSSSRDEKSSARFREHSHGRQDRDYTSEQKAAVERIRKCKATAYYEILAITKEATDGQIKKAYHKLSLATHPDKNGAPGADEAFKLVSKAFQVLSDPQKRSIYDTTGADPENRRAPSGPSFSGGASPFGDGSPFGGGGGFEAEISPEDLFNMFFGGGMGAGGMFADAFGPGGGTSFAFGGPGIRVHQFGGPRMRRRTQQQHQRAQQTGDSENAPLPPLSRMFWQLLPLIIFFIFPLLSGLFSSSTTSSGPRFSMHSTPPFTELRTTPTHDIPFFVNPVEIRDMTRKDVANFEKRAEARIINTWNTECRKEEMERERQIQDAIGIVWTDYERLERAKKRPMPFCEKLAEIQSAKKKKSRKN